jgi:hypothetical protein
MFTKIASCFTGIATTILVTSLAGAATYSTVPAREGLIGKYTNLISYGLDYQQVYCATASSATGDMRISLPIQGTSSSSNSLVNATASFVNLPATANSNHGVWARLVIFSSNGYMAGGGAIVGSTNQSQNSQSLDLGSVGTVFPASERVAVQVSVGCAYGGSSTGSRLNYIAYNY